MDAELGAAIREVEELGVSAFQKLGMDPAHIYAYQHCQFLVTYENHDVRMPGELDDWREAVWRYRRLHGDAAGTDMYATLEIL